MTDKAGVFAELLMASGVGLVLGSLFFGGLWLTLRRIPNWRHPGLGMLASLLLRLALVGSGLYLLADGHWQRYAAALPGLLIARWWWVRRIEPRKIER
jgi:F1F0 ATPase subunit 2